MRLGFLDFLRFFASGAVLFQHVAEVTFPGVFGSALAWSPGVFGVVLFFFVSGYVIPFSVRKRFSISSFLIRRVCRIYPAFMVTIALILLAGYLGAPHFAPAFETIDLSGMLSNFAMTAEITRDPMLLPVTWTISLEFAWYFIFLCLFVNFGYSRIFSLSILATAGLIVLSGLSVLTDFRLPFGRMGMLNAALIGYAAYGYHNGLLDTKKFLATFSFFVVGLLITQYIAFGVFQHATMTLFNTYAGWLLATGFFFAFIMSKRLQNSSLINNRVLIWLGSISYSVYLTHDLVLGLLRDNFDPLVVASGTIALTVLLSAGMFYLVEKPGMKLGRYLSDLYSQLTRQKKASEQLNAI